jgi:hypothetical protein
LMGVAMVEACRRRQDVSGRNGVIVLAGRWWWSEVRLFRA